MSQDSSQDDNLALRTGAASLYLLVGLAIGLVAAIAAAYLRPQHVSEPFAAIVFGTSGLCALIAAAFPVAAVSAIAPVAHFVWGFINGSLMPEWVGRVESGASSIERWLFWLGVGAGVAVLLAWLLS